MKVKKILKYVAVLSLLFIAVSVFFSSELEGMAIMFIAEFGFLGVVVISILSETTPFPVGPEMAFIAGKVVEFGIGKVTIILLVVSIIGSFFNYYVGTRFYPRVCKEAKCDKVKKVYEKYGKWGLMVSALGPVPYVPFCWTSGAFGMTRKDFVHYAIVPRIIRLSTVAIIVANYVRPEMFIQI